MIIVTEKSDLSNLECEVESLVLLEKQQNKLREILNSGAQMSLSLECEIGGKKQQVQFSPSSSLGFFTKIFNKVV